MNSIEFETDLCKARVEAYRHPKVDIINTGFRPLGGFYCNYMGQGVISIEDEDPNFDGAESRKRHVAAIKQAIDIILEKGFPGTTLTFNF